MNVIEHAKMKWASAIVSVHRKDRTIRLSVAYHKLNSATIQDSYTIPCVDKCINLLGNVNIYFLHCTLIAVVDESRMQGSVVTKPPLPFAIVSSSSFACPLD